MWVHWLNHNIVLTFLCAVQPKRSSAAIWQHRVNLPAPYEHNPDQWVLRAGYKAQRPTKTTVRLMTTTNSPVLSSWPAEMRISTSKSAAEAAAPRFQQYLNSSERKTAPKRAAPSPDVGATPQQHRTEQLCPASKRQCPGTVNVSTALRTFTACVIVAASQYKKTRKRQLLCLSRIQKTRDVRQLVRHAKLQHSLARNTKQVRKYNKYCTQTVRRLANRNLKMCCSHCQFSVHNFVSDY